MPLRTAGGSSPALHFGPAWYGTHQVGASRYVKALLSSTLDTSQLHAALRSWESEPPTRMPYSASSPNMSQTGRHNALNGMDINILRRSAESFLATAATLIVATHWSIGKARHMPCTLSLQRYLINSLRSCNTLQYCPSNDEALRWRWVASKACTRD